MSGIELSHAVPVFACADVAVAITFCVRRLGFEREWIWGEPPTDGCAKRDDVRLLFMCDAELATRAKGTEVMVFVHDVDALYSEHVGRGAPIVSALIDKPWDAREYTVEVPPGYLLRFAEGQEHIRKRLGT